MRTILIAGYYGFGNAGDEAILAGMLADLRALGPDVDFLAASGDPAGTRADHGVRAFPRDDLEAAVAAVRESDLVLLGGGGLFQDYWESATADLLTRRQGGLALYLSFPVLAALAGKPAMVYAAGVGPLRTPEGRRQARAAFELCQRATVRDAESLALLRETGLPETVPVEVAADPAFSLPPAGDRDLAAILEELGAAPGEPLLGVALRPWPIGSGAGGGAPWEQEVARALDLTLERFQGRALFLPVQAGDDVEVHRRVQKAMAARGRTLLAGRRLPPAVLAGLLGRCDRVLAMRFHATLFALAAGAPAVGLASDPKIPSLMARAGLAELSLVPEEWRAERIAEALCEAGGHGERRTLAGFAEAMRRQARRSAEIALELLAAGPPEVSAAARLMGEVALNRALAACRLEDEKDLLRARVEDQWEQMERYRGWLQSAESDRDAGRQTIEALREQRDVLLAERNGLDRRLSALEGTLSYRIITRFWRLMRFLFPEGSRRRKLYRLARRILGRAVGGADAPEAAWREGMGGAPAPAAAPGAEVPDPRADLLAFEERLRACAAQQVVAVFSATQLLESEGQRPTQLALALSRRGVPVVFVYWRWWDNEWRPQDRLEDGILQVPIDVVTRRPEMLTGAFQGLSRTVFFEFPHPGFFETLATANAAGWITVYDVLDDWEEFHRVGQAVWYDEPFERHLIRACDAVFAVNEVLAGRVRGLGGGVAEGAEVVGNGLRPGIEVVREPRPLERGEVTVGYFGYLAGAWFDWELIAAAARLRPGWRFYLIGYGGSPEGIELPETVVLLGKQPQADLAAWAANWDVAVIPFKPDRLAAGADPIKTYEYLAMGLPVAATGVYPPAGGEAFVDRADSAEGFVEAVERAAARRSPEEEAARRAFAAACTWDHRIGEMLASIEQGRQRVAEKRALLGVRP